MINWSNFENFFSTGIPHSILYGSLIVTCVSLVIILFSSRIIYKKKILIGVLLFEYVFIVVCSTIICRGVQSFEFARLELTPFWTYRAVINHIPGVSVWDIVLNVVLFIPLGFLMKLLLPKLRLWKLLLIAVVCSVLIETNQYVFEKGVAQIDDVIHNTIGAGLGWCLAFGGLAFENVLKRIKSL